MTGAHAHANPIQRARALGRSGRLSEALSLLDSARARDPRNADILIALAAIARRLSMDPAAERCLTEALAIDASRLEAIVALGAVKAALGRPQEAIDFLKDHTLAKPLHPELWTALANILRAEGEFGDAEVFFREALRLDPSNLPAQVGLADISFDRGETDAAIAAYTAAIKVASKNPQLRLNRSLALLHCGDTKAGWRDYEWRLKIEGREILRDFGKGPAVKRWDGRRVPAKALAILGEQGIGDQIFFSSCIGPALALASPQAAGIECDPRLMPLLARTFRDLEVHAFSPKSEEGRITADAKWVRKLAPLPLSIELASLPFILGKADIKVKGTPLKVDAVEKARWRDWLKTLGPGPKIGICWRSGKTGGLRRAQYAPLSDWINFLSATDAIFVSVQYDPAPGEIEAMSTESNRAVHVPPELDQRNEIDRLGALLSSLDAVVSSPTAVAALSAAVETLTFKITLSGSWTGLGADTEPFRPASRILTGATIGDWPAVFQSAHHQICALAQTA